MPAQKSPNEKRHATKAAAGQGSMEYLLLIGGVVLVAVIVILLIMQTSKSAGGEVNATAEGGMVKIKEEAGIALGGPGTVAKLYAGNIGAPTTTADLSGLATGILAPPSSGAGGGGNGGIVPPDGGGSATFTFYQGGGDVKNELQAVKAQ
ncbi:MAG: class III signal peptide-containing protein [Candidatus Diapherotrites archaeon]